MKCNLIIYNLIVFNEKQKNGRFKKPTQETTPHDARGEELKERLSHGLHDAILEESEVERGRNIDFLLFLINSPTTSREKKKHRTKVHTTKIHGEKTEEKTETFVENPW